LVAVEDLARDRMTDSVTGMEQRTKSEWFMKLFQLLRLLLRYPEISSFICILTDCVWCIMLSIWRHCLLQLFNWL